MERNHEFDIIVWGASGFVGRRVAHHMAARYGSGGDDLAACDSDVCVLENRV